MLVSFTTNAQHRPITADYKKIRDCILAVHLVTMSNLGLTSVPVVPMDCVTGYTGKIQQCHLQFKW